MGPDCPFKKDKCTHIQSDDYDEYYDGVLYSKSILFQEDEFADPLEIALENYYRKEETIPLDRRDMAMIAFMILVFVFGNLIGPSFFENLVRPLF